MLKEFMQKKWVVYALGIVSGIALTFIVLYLMAGCSSSNGVKYFEKPGDCISTNSFKVFQVLDEGVALANEIEEYEIPTGVVVLLINDEGKYYYDDQIIKVPSGKCARQVGVYIYPTKMEIEKTVPIVKIMK